ncbi:T9SS type A sorting domain-containing protein [Winogradskyella ludwigii]|uniref:T9SS type A sorting domain-containing protein n=1 Tax=Winogradskyella ludwigii TaxID=2686076 RepID=UPI0015C9FB97|nr:T9SS type A sorting domain-containing protein [Winogradskyella ludwigii]
MKFSKYPLVYLVTLIFVCLSFCNLNAQQPAFPSAKGAGGYASGGRGGEVIHVTTLDWEAEGGLKQALLTTGPRTIVFDVSGEIDASTEPQWEYLLDGSNYDNLTIAGQTAPLGGITIKTSQFFIHNLDNVIIRYIRFRRSASSGFNSSALWLRGCTNVIVDHCSLSHGGDETFDLSSSDGTSANTTIQNCFFQDSQKGMILGTDTRNEATVLDDLGNFTLVDNVFMNIDHRFPNPQGNGQYDIINNIVYNWKNRLIRITQEGTYNILNNYYKTADDGLRRPGWFVGDAVIVNQLQKIQAQPEDNPLIYTAGNIITGQRETPQTDDRDMWTYFAGSHASFPENDLAADNFFTTTQFPLIGKSYTIKTAQETYDDLLTDVGTNKTLNADGTINNYLDSKDESDILVIKNDEFVSVDANFTYPSASDVPYPVIPENLRPSDFYVSNPHIPEAYFLANVPSGEDHNDFAPSGYTWLEEYLNGVDQSSLPPVSVESVVVTPNPSEILISETLQLTKTISPANANNQNGTWSSSDEDIATVDENGLVTPISVGVVVITFTTSDGSFTDTSQITVFPDALLASAGADQQICEGESTTLTATGGTSYLWSTGETTSSIEVSPLTLTSYSVIVSDDYSQSEDVSVTVTVNALPSVDLGEDQIICEGESITLTASGGTSYLWSTGETTASIEVSPTSDTIYSVEVSENNCSSTDEVIITVNTAPVISVSEDIVIVTGESTTLTASGSTTYDWSTGETSASIIVSPLVTTTYSVSSTAVGGCVSNTETITVTVIPEIIADVNEDKTICSGDTVTLTATGGTSYLWNTGETTATIEVSPNVTTTYTVTVEDDYGYTDTSEVTITVNTAPTLAVSEDIVIVTGESTTLTASGSTTYDWSTGETSASIIVSPLVTTTYSVNSTVVGGCVSNTETITVTVIPEIIADVNEDETICSGETVTLTATGGTSYLWNTGETTATIEVSPTVTTTYTVTAEDDYGYTDSVEVTVNVNEMPNITVNDDVFVMIGNAITLTANGGNTYAWNTGDTTSQITVNPVVTTTYTVTGTSVGGCQNTDEVTVTVVDELTANAGEDTSICLGESIMLNASGGLTYTWNTGGTGASPVVSPLETTTYSVTVTDGFGNSATDDVVITVNSMPTANAGNDEVICEGESVVLTAEGGDSYLWSTGATTASITVNPVLDITYSVEVFSNACSDIDEVSVFVQPTPEITLTQDLVIMNGNSATLEVSGAESYLWNTGDTSNSIVVNPTVTTTYNVTGFSASNCEASAEVTITVVPEVNANAGNDVAICLGESVSLTASGGINYSWNTGETNTSMIVSPIETTTYTVTVTDDLGNSDSDSVTVTVNELPTLILTEDVTIFEGESINLTVNGAESYLWNTGDTSNSIVVNPTITSTYSVTGFSSSNCETSAEVTVTVVPEVNANAGNDVAICLGESIALNASGGINYSWNTGETNTSIIVSPIETTTYTVTVTDDLGNSDSDNVTVTVNELPLISTSENITIIEGESTELIVNGAVAYLWNTGDTSSSITVNPTQTTIYSVVGISNTCTSEPSEIIVTVIPLFQASAGTDSRVCDNESYEVILTATEGDSYLWSTGETTQSIVVNPLSTTSYSVTVSEGIQEASDEVMVYVDPSPNVVIANGESVEILSGDFITLSASGANTYEWNNGASQPNIAVSPSVTTTYVVKGYIGQCLDEQQIIVNVIPKVVADAGEDVLICVDDLVTLTATGGDEYVWNTGETTSSISVSPIETTDYTVTVFNALDFDEATVRVEVDLNCTTDTIDNPNEETLEVALDIYPNPANGFVNIKLSGSLIVSDVHIFDVTGKRVKQIRITNDDSNLTTTAQVDISALQSGIYFVKLIDENNNITKKLIVN